MTKHANTAAHNTAMQSASMAYDAAHNTASIVASVASSTPITFYSPDDANMIDFIRYLVKADPRIGEFYTAWRATKKLTD